MYGVYCRNVQKKKIEIEYFRRIKRDVSAEHSLCEAARRKNKKLFCVEQNDGAGFVSCAEFRDKSVSSVTVPRVHEHRKARVHKIQWNLQIYEAEQQHEGRERRRIMAFLSGAHKRHNRKGKFDDFSTSQ